MRVLVTGATGLIGRHLLELIGPRHQVTALARTVPPSGGGDAVSWVRQDLTRPLDRGALPDRIDGIVHLAQSDRYRDFPDGADDVFEVNVHSTLRLLEYARECGAGRFVLASTGGVYARSERPLHEDDPLEAPGFYPHSKLMAELLVGDYSGMFSAVILRPFFVYGPGQRSMLIPRLIDDVHHGRPVAIDGSDGLHLNPIFASDAARAFECALELHQGGIFNVAGNERTTIKGIVQLISEITRREARIRSANGEGATHLVACTRRMQRVLHVKPGVSLREGIAAMVTDLGTDGGEVKHAR